MHQTKRSILLSQFFTQNSERASRVFVFLVFLSITLYDISFYHYTIHYTSTLVIHYQCCVHSQDQNYTVMPHGFQLCLTKTSTSIMLHNTKNVYVTWMSSISLFSLTMTWLVQEYTEIECRCYINWDLSVNVRCQPQCIARGNEKSPVEFLCCSLFIFISRLASLRHPKCTQKVLGLKCIYFLYGCSLV